MTESVIPAARRERELVLPSLSSAIGARPERDLGETDHEDRASERFRDTVDDDGADADSYGPDLDPIRDNRKRVSYPKKDGDQFDELVKTWLARGPGTYLSRSSHDLYRAAWADFRAATDFDPIFRERDFLLALARLGFEAGVVMFRGREVFILLLPSKMIDAMAD